MKGACGCCLGGRLVVPYGPADRAQNLLIVDKNHDGSLKEEVAMSVKYVPLTSRQDQLSRAYWSAPGR